MSPPADSVSTQLTSWEIAIPSTIAACWKDARRPRYFVGATSAMYVGAITDAMPMAAPPSTRHRARSQAANGSIEPTALTPNRIAPAFITRIRP